MAKYVPMGQRICDIAYLRDHGNEYTGEQLALALLLHAQGNKRSKRELRKIQEMLDDPNL
jgi:hypothetical protein